MRASLPSRRRSLLLPCCLVLAAALAAGSFLQRHVCSSATFLGPASDRSGAAVQLRQEEARLAPARISSLAAAAGLLVGPDNARALPIYFEGEVWEEGSFPIPTWAVAAMMTGLIGYTIWFTYFWVGTVVFGIGEDEDSDDDD
mmetsp:Transcript_22706/g.52989  ORF Transcript_22706/g.52989 Transcript_22706/m.52989 type:complete len:143 (-) Transcript_22706:176-604(-)